jgi:nucleotide-binding universal stress UspA family protein
MSIRSELSYSAVSDFRRARQKAALKQVLARLTGTSVDLLSFTDVTRGLRAIGSADRGLQDIPLEAIAGSVGRRNDFTRDFLPRNDADQTRWARVKQAAADPGTAGLPPIKVYKIGEAYFVIDGHHRVSVARQMGATHMQAYVTEVHTKVPLSANVTPEELILKSEFAEFLEHTQLDRSRPGSDLSVSTPGQIQLIEAQIHECQRPLSERQEEAVPLETAAEVWYDQTYLLVAHVIREQGLGRDFPGLTEADLFLQVTAHREALEQSLGWSITPEVGASDLAAQKMARRAGPVLRAGKRLLAAVVPDELKDGPAAGQWRRDRIAARYTDRLFADILVPVSGEPIGWEALQQAIDLARQESAQLHGLHVVSSEAERAGQAAGAVRAEFERRCQEAGVAGSLAIEVGEVGPKICALAALTDLVVLNLAYPPAPERLARLGSGFRTIIRRCPRPVLAVPRYTPFPERPLLAYDASPKAEEALFVATYLAEARQAPLVVIMVMQAAQMTHANEAHVREYLDLHEVAATLVIRDDGPVAELIVAAADEHDCNVIISGGYGAHPIVEVVLGSTVDQVLREAGRPLLICR